MKPVKPSHITFNQWAMAMHNLSHTFRRFIITRIEEDAMMAIHKTAPVLSFQELMDEFQVDAETVRAILDMEARMGHFWAQTYPIKIEGLDTSVPMQITVRAELPKRFRCLTASSSLVPAIKFVQEWATLRHIFEQVSLMIERNSLINVFPWIRDVVREEPYILGAKGVYPNRGFYRKYLITSPGKDRPKFDACMKAAMGVGLPSRISAPLMPSILREGATLGNKLFTQARLLKTRPDVKAPDGKLKIEIALSEGTISPAIISAIQEMQNFQAKLAMQSKEITYDD